MAEKKDDGSKSMEKVWLFTGEFVGAALEMVELKDGDFVLDVAAGTGSSALPLAKKYKAAGKAATILATDFLEGMVEKCKEKAEELEVSDIVECKTMNALDLQVPDTSVDVAMCMFGVFLLPDPEKAMSELARVVKTGGQFVSAWWKRVPTMSLLPPLLEMNGLDTSVMKAIEEKTFKYNTAEKLTAFFESHGFTDVVVDSAEFDFPTHLMAADPNTLLANPSLKEAFSGVSAESITSCVNELMEKDPKEFTTAESWIISMKRK